MRPLARDGECRCAIDRTPHPGRSPRLFVGLSWFLVCGFILPLLR